MESYQQMLVSSFLEIAVDQTADTARRFLQTTSWNLEEAIQLFYNNELVHNPSLNGAADNWGQYDGDNVDDDDHNIAVPYIGNGSSHNLENKILSSRPGDVWRVEERDDNLSSMYRPPFALLYNGPFNNAIDTAKTQNKWLLVNVQSMQEFTSHMLNRDTWANDYVARIIKKNFIFWQVNDDTEEGQKVCTYYKLNSLPVILVIDPITGQKMRSWNGMVQPENLLEDITSFIDLSPSEYYANLLHKRSRKNPRDEIKEDEGIQQSNEIKEVMKIFYPPLSEEPKGDKNLICRVAIRLFDGRRIQRNFLKTDSIKLLWSYCCVEFEEAETRPFRFRQVFPGSVKFLEYDSNLTFEESDLNNSIVSVTWE
ncbi:plant UBX domain-containing protein 7-like [Nicotiana tomentosiformis]|uniref:plant UBX domain-containing protein 7-like n=1 Tax=Nicotiana tomentosiformis TaxID=4098 RepID=UPI00051CA5C8|nr:plant UBX domain-containing protein 7-like [Nicotiana tomentosiformis]